MLSLSIDLRSPRSGFVISHRHWRRGAGATPCTDGGTLKHRVILISGIYEKLVSHQLIICRPHGTIAMASGVRAQSLSVEPSTCNVRHLLIVTLSLYIPRHLARVMLISSIKKCE